MTTIRESDLPGIGRKFQIEARSGDKLVVIVHDDGRREIYHYDNEDPDESISMVTLDDTEARRVAGIIGGMAYIPKALEAVDVEFDEMVIEWYKVEPDYKAIGVSIGDLHVRKSTGATIIAMVKKNQERLINPGPDQKVKEGYILVLLGEREQVKACKRLIKQGSL
ncbi:cation:proton antiporter regulatory subunit [Desulforamulus aquiferis]|uniref:Cation:proton antiporter regulatory subunit n=1 Tax=Desulforamulus aquiferis TaxID=1397668 RepID=A0AAW7Z9H7_9FIRM|nr:cation:proton antiporter regulatory subunit [Desulforamulus aquiferis]MDO7786078.1 cation:proton antiporter regulatory subunit [Desulforamulus aquiferis]RYD05133.1 hypothetical protein N752_11205 [Desulforamulus aquiferis]